MALVIILLILMGTLLLPSTVAAQNTTCNTTATLSMPEGSTLDFETYIDDAVTDLRTELIDQVETFIYVLIVSAMTALAYWRKETPLYITSGIGLIIFGLYFTDTIMSAGILIAALGGWTGVRGLLKLRR